jgi:hypothetical protein
MGVTSNAAVTHMTLVRFSEIANCFAIEYQCKYQILLITYIWRVLFLDSSERREMRAWRAWSWRSESEFVVFERASLSFVTHYPDPSVGTGLQPPFTGHELALCSAAWAHDPRPHGPKRSLGGKYFGVGVITVQIYPLNALGG